MARGDEQIREAERTALATGAVTDVARLHALLVAKGRPTYEVAQALGKQAQAVAAATEAELAALCACRGKGAIYQYTQDAYGSGEEWVSCRHPQDELERMGVLNARLLVQKKAVNLWAQALTVHPGQTAVYVNKRARAKYQNGAKAKVEVGTMGTVLETHTRYYGGSARRRSERSTTSALVCDGCGLMYWTNVTNLAVLDPLGAWLDHWRIMEEQDAETPDQAQERIQRGVFPYRATEGLWRRAPAPPAWTPARGQYVRFADGVEGEVFWVGGDRGGSLRVGVRVPGEQQPRWANAAEVLPVAANPCPVRL